jgi:hypothetical protein
MASIYLKKEKYTIIYTSTLKIILVNSGAILLRDNSFLEFKIIVWKNKFYIYYNI